MSFNVSGLVAAGALAMAFATGAQAATVTINASSTQGIGNMAHVYAASYAANTPDGASWDVDPTVSNMPLTVGKDYKSPFFDTPLAMTQTYFAADSRNASNGNAVTTPATLSYTSAQTAFKMLWGSIDRYNRIEFFNGATSVFSYTGNEMATLLGMPTALNNLEMVALVSFAGFDAPGFDSIRFSSGQPAFEFALPQIPVPAAGVLLLTALGGIAALRRRKAA